MNDGSENPVTKKPVSIEERLTNVENAIAAINAVVGDLQASGNSPQSGLLTTIHGHLQDLFPSRFPKTEK